MVNCDDKDKLLQDITEDSSREVCIVNSRKKCSKLRGKIHRKDPWYSQNLSFPLIYRRKGFGLEEKLKVFKVLTVSIQNYLLWTQENFTVPRSKFCACVEILLKQPEKNISAQKRICIVLHLHFIHYYFTLLRMTMILSWWLIWEMW